MENTQHLLNDLMAATRHCGLNWILMLEDYYNYQIENGDQTRKTEFEKKLLGLGPASRILTRWSTSP